MVSDCLTLILIQSGHANISVDQTGKNEVVWTEIAGDDWVLEVYFPLKFDLFSVLEEVESEVGVPRGSEKSFHSLVVGIPDYFGDGVIGGLVLGGFYFLLTVGGVVTVGVVAVAGLVVHE